MRKVVVYQLLSLDGVAESCEEFVTEWDEAMDANLAAVIGRQDAVILGRRSHDEWATYWPTSDVEPFATFINGVTKHVATSSPLPDVWPGAVAIDRGLLDVVADLKEQPGGDIGVHASISVARSLIAAEMVDELRLVVAPSLAGRGRRLLDELPAARFELFDSVTSPSGYLLLAYRPRPS